MGVVLNHNNPSEGFVIFPNYETVPDILKLADAAQWMGTHMNLTVGRPRAEIIPIIAKFLGVKPWRKGKNMNSYKLKYWKQRGQHTFLPQRKGRWLLLPCWQIKLSPFKLRN